MHHSGNLLIMVGGRPYNSLRPGDGILNIANYDLEPLFSGYQGTSSFQPDQPGDNWFLGKQLSFIEGNPWDLAHRVAIEAGYALYVEPDLLQDLRRKPVTPTAIEPTEGLNPNWPPAAPVSPALLTWTLDTPKNTSRGQ